MDLRMQLIVAILAGATAIVALGHIVYRRERREFLAGREDIDVHLLVQDVMTADWVPPAQAREAWWFVAKSLDLPPTKMRATDELATIRRIHAWGSDGVKSLHMFAWMWARRQGDESRPEFSTVREAVAFIAKNCPKLA
jgi:hypothetical protein